MTESLVGSVDKVYNQELSHPLRADRLFLVLLLSASESSLVSELICCWSTCCWLLVLVCVDREGPVPAVFFAGPCVTARRFLYGEVFTEDRWETKNMNEITS